MATEPELLLEDEDLIWRVPLILSLPNLGNLGQVGIISIDARTGEIPFDHQAKERIIKHARWLYQGATLSTKS